MSNHSTMTDFPLEQAIVILEALKDCQDDNARLNVLRDALREGYQYRHLAHYLADCSAATVESAPKSTSKSAMARLRSICETAAQGLRSAGAFTRTQKDRYYTVDGRLRAQQRCEEAAKPDTK